jgi:hypothetical protein
MGVGVIKKLIVTLINKVFGLNLSEADLDSFIAFIRMLIGIFGSKDDAVRFCKQTTRKANSADPMKAKEVLHDMDKKMGEV